MKTNITSVLLTGLKLTFLCLFLISISLKLHAQDELKRTYLELNYTKNGDGLKSLTAKIKYKENRKFTPIVNETISFYSGIDLDELIEKVETNSEGEASIEVPEELEADSTGYYNFAAEFEGTEKFKSSDTDVSVKDSRLELTFSQKSTGRMITIHGFEIQSDTETPLSDEDVVILIPTLFGEMKIGESTLEDGSCQIPFPSDLPGDSLGVLQIIAKIQDSADFGNVMSMETIPWGRPKAMYHAEEVLAKGKLWTPNAPLWMTVTLLILLLGVWSHFGYIIFKMYKINKEGSEKAEA